MKTLWIFLALLSTAYASDRIALYQGFVTKIHCDGRLLVSAVGNDALVRLDALPKELGCGVLLKPVASGGNSNLILETTTGTISTLIEIESKTRLPKASELEFQLKGASQ
jgi:hypothetical protein